MIVKLLLFLFGVQLFFYGLFAGNWVLFGLGVVNFVVILFLFDLVDTNNIKSFYEKVINYYQNLDLSDYRDRVCSGIQNIGNYFSSIIQEYNQYFSSENKENLDNENQQQQTPSSLFFSYLYYFNKHYIFVVSALILVFAIADNIFFQEYGINFWLSLFVFMVSFLANIHELMNNELYLGHRKISQKDFVFVANILLIFFVYNALEGMEVITKLLVSFLVGLIFYLIAVQVLGLRGGSRLLINDNIMKVYGGVFVVLIFGYAWNTYPQIYDFFVVERQVVEYVEKETTEEDEDKEEAEEDRETEEIPNEEDYVIVEEIVAPNENRYQVYKDTKEEEVWLYWDDGTRMSFDEIEQAEEVIIANNPQESDQHEEIEEPGETEEPREDDQDVEDIQETFEGLLEGEQTEEDDPQDLDEIEQLVGKEFGQDQSLTYEYVIPYLIRNYGSLEEGRSEVVFDNLSQEDDIYPYFKEAQHQRLIGTNITPENEVRCRNYITMFGLLQDWDVDYTNETIFDEFWSKGEDLGQIPSGCSPYEFLTQNILES